MINLWWRMICRNKRLYKWFIFVPTRRIRIGSAAGRIIFFFFLANTQISLRDSRNMVGSSTERALLILQTYSHASSCICEQRALLIIFASVKNWIFNIAILRKHCTLPTPYIYIYIYRHPTTVCVCYALSIFVPYHRSFDFSLRSYEIDFIDLCTFEICKYQKNIHSELIRRRLSKIYGSVLKKYCDKWRLRLFCFLSFFFFLNKISEHGELSKLTKLRIK